MSLVTTPGAANANSFSTVDEFKTYRTNRYPQVTAVLSAVDAAIEAALIVAARGMDAGFDWTGAAVDEVQAMTWPRTGMLTRNKFAIASSGASSIPQALKDAQCEWAYQLLAGADFTSDNDAAKQGVASVKAGSVAVSFQSVDTSTYESVDMIIRRLGSDFNYLNAPAEVRRLLVDSWFNQPSIFRPLEFIATGGSNGAC
jgi:hypothetical protein